MAICQHCGQEFEAEPWRERKYCGRECAYAARRGPANPAWSGGKIKRICEYCGEEFKIYPSKLKWGYGKSCSLSCAAKSRTGKRNPNWSGGRQLVECDYCGETFEVNPAEAANARFCSRDCSSYWWAQQPHETKRIILTCEICGEQYETWPSRSDRRVCSRECAYELKSRQLQGKNSPFWEGGKSDISYPPEFSQRLKRLVRERDEYTCVLCGSDDAIEIHHVTYDKTRNDMSELVVLCMRCHKMVHHTRTHEYWIREINRRVSVKSDYFVRSE